MFPLQDNRIIQAHGPYTVLAQRHEVMFHDGTALHLHPVAESGFQQPHLRALQVEGMRWLVFDLHRLTPEIELDLRRLHPRDHIGAVFYTLRGRFHTAGACTAAANQCAAASWWQHAAPMAAAA